ncbi:MAG: PAS domain S-box protein [Spirochaetaceae bacterium]|nr:PAS domain S-box protein [Spirochaetaceae bacterium]
MDFKTKAPNTIISDLQRENSSLINRITELENQLTELKESESIYKSLVDLMPQRLLRKDNDGRITFANRAYLDELGLSFEEAQGKSDEELFPPHFVDIYKNADAEVHDTQNVVDVEEDHWLLKENRRIPVQVVKAPIYNDDGSVKGVQAIFWDISTRKKAENELQQLQDYLFNIIESMPSVLIGVDKECRVTQWNRSAENLTGIQADEARGEMISRVFPSLASDMDKIVESIKTCQVMHEQKKRRHDGSQVYYEDLTIFPIIAEEIEGAVIRIDNVTEKIRLEEMMIQSDKMLSIGGLAAGIAHEINNPLAGMIQSAAVISKRLTDLDLLSSQKTAREIGIELSDIKAFMEKREIPRMIENIDQAGQRIADIVHNMLSFARKSDLQFTSENLKLIIEQTIDLAATDYNLKKKYDFKSILIKREYDESIPLVPCDRTKIQQVIFNLLGNSSQALFNGGTDNPEISIRVRLNSEKDMVEIEVEDNGPGIDELVQKRIFEPFYTTKPEGVGTGLGLSICYYIITENHKGELLVHSKPGSGARFVIVLPLDV